MRARPHRAHPSWHHEKDSYPETSRSYKLWADVRLARTGHRSRLLATSGQVGRDAFLVPRVRAQRQRWVASTRQMRSSVFRKESSCTGESSTYIHPGFWTSDWQRCNDGAAARLQAACLQPACVQQVACEIDFVIVNEGKSLPLSLCLSVALDAFSSEPVCLCISIVAGPPWEE